MSIKNKKFKYIILKPTGIFGKNDYFVFFEFINMINQGLLFFIPGSGFYFMIINK